MREQAAKDGGMRNLLNRHRYEASLLLGFVLLFLSLGYAGKGETPWLDWLFFVLGVMATTIFICRFVFPLSTGAFYGPLIGWWIFVIGMNISDLSEIGYGALYFGITLAIWWLTNKLCVLVERRKNNV
jgi:hypothetical protein